MSALLDSPDAKRLKDSGNMVGDREVVSLLLRELLKPEFRDGVVLMLSGATGVAALGYVVFWWELLVQLWAKALPHLPWLQAV